MNKTLYSYLPYYHDFHDFTSQDQAGDTSPRTVSDVTYFVPMFPICTDRHITVEFPDILPNF